MKLIAASHCRNLTPEKVTTVEMYRVSLKHDGTDRQTGCERRVKCGYDTIR